MDPTTISEEVVLTPEEIGQTLGILRTVTTRHVETMRRSLKRHGQLTPVLVASMTKGYEMVDGFKRLRAALELPKLQSLQCRVVATDSRSAKIVMLCQKPVSSGLNDIEMALIIRSLHRDEKMKQTEIAAALGRHKTWVCRRLKLAEGLSRRAQDDIRVGLLSPTAARALTRLPRGNQAPVLDALLSVPLSSREYGRFVKLYEAAKSQAERSAILANPQGALLAKRRQETTIPVGLSEVGEKMFRNIQLLERVATSLVSFLEATDPTQDLALLRPSLQRLKRMIVLLAQRIPGQE